MRVLTLEGDKVVLDQNYQFASGHFIFMFMENGVFYLDTTIGQLWKFDPNNPSTLGEEHLKIVNKVLESME